MTGRREREAATIQRFVRQYERVRGSNRRDPNDRGYDRLLAGRIRRMRPEELDALLRDGEDETDAVTRD